MTSPSGYDTYSAMINVLKRKPDSTEAELSMPTVNLVNAVSEPVDVSVRHEQSLPDPNDDRRSKRPDLQVRTGDDVRVIGYVELKHITKPADPQLFSDAHDKRQWGSFKSLPNIVYSNGVAATLWRDGKLVASASVKDEANWVSLWRLFLLYTPQIDSAPDALAVTMGLRVRLLREAVADALADGNDDLHRLFGSWKGLLATDFEEDAFADNFAQTTMAGLLLAKGLASPTQAAAFGLSVGEEVLRLAGHAVLAEVLDHVVKAARKDPVLDIHVTSIVDAVAAVDQQKPSKDNWWVEFYEPFVREYDQKLQQDRGVFYTPSQIVDYQIRCADWVLRNHLHKQDGFADSEVIALDPACGTGTYLTRLVEHVVAVTCEQRGDGAVQEAVGRAVKNLYGFEVMVAPYTITRMRLATKCQTYGAKLADNRVILTDTLSSPSTQLPLFPMFNDAIAKEQEQANVVKDKGTRVTVVVGNPPYDRDQSQAQTDPVDRASELRFGGIVRHGDSDEHHRPLINTFRDKTTSGGIRQFHTCYELATYFWRWAIWKVCEQAHPGETSPGGPGIVSFITPSAWLRSEPWSGMRAHMRQQFDHIWVIDLGGDNRAARYDGENVFPIQTPVCVAIAVRVGVEQPTKPAKVMYRKLVGSKADKLKALTEVSLDDGGWETASPGYTEKFLPVGPDDWYANEQPINKVLHWSSPGVQYNRTWPIGLTDRVLEERWNQLATAVTTDEKAVLFKQTRDRYVIKEPAPLPTYKIPKPGKIADLSKGDSLEELVRYGYRLFDVRKAIPDSRLGDMMRPKLWECHNPNQAYLVTPQPTEPAGEGPTAVIFTDIPDKHSHHGHGGGVVFPLWRDVSATDANADELTVKTLRERYKQQVVGDDVWYYCAGLLGTDAYHQCFGEAMSRTLKPHVAFPENWDDFVTLVNVGKRLVEISRGLNLDRSGVKCPAAVNATGLPVFNDNCYDRETDSLALGGGRFTGVTDSIWDHQVSGYRTLRRWIKARSVKPGGRRSSPLDDIQPDKWTFTNELIDVCDQIASLNNAAVIAEPVLQRIVASNRPDNE